MRQMTSVRILTKQTKVRIKSQKTDFSKNGTLKASTQVDKIS